MFNLKPEAMKLAINLPKPQVYYLKLPALLLFVLTLITSCNTEDTYLDENADLQRTIVEVLDSYGSESEGSDNESTQSRMNRPTFRTLNVALARTGLAGTVSSNRLTVFAPTDAAFEKYGLNQRNIVSTLGVETLRSILLYHAVAGTVFSGDLPSNGFVATLNGASVEVNVGSSVTINDATVVIADIEARNGVIHAIDDVLFPPTQNLVELASSFDPEFSVLLAAAIKAELAATLANDGPFTVFAPTNQAFMNLLGVNTVQEAIDAVNGLAPEDLAPILLYHVVPGRVFSTDLSSGPVETLNGSFDLDLETLTIDGNAMLVPSLLNVQATNGVIHVINSVLIP
ncbi:fasciclin domain-containing protein [Paucihalobacter ruber]|uniref:Fasciclin domain-containing protein n=2 Tax=Paucihalobacter ruber TaxID=2567861 RepID=A0A506PLZ3_9FLAO|nr:fasciclin domain-containing protein [Paucihalobacter ruber]